MTWPIRPKLPVPWWVDVLPSPQENVSAIVNEVAVDWFGFITKSNSELFAELVDPIKIEALTVESQPDQVDEESILKKGKFWLKKP